jgi:2-succinyl-6-hydroxy-2,4-cyclohexadiene-1-carboxylate synthase
MKGYALHGFLGEPKDLAFLSEEFICCDYLQWIDENTKDFTTWAHRFDAWVSAPATFLGYSMGGRFALEYTKHFPQKVNRLILISTQLNRAPTEASIQARQANDQAWAERFLHDPLSDVLKDWNKQSVFAGSKVEPIRDVSKWNRQLLAKLLIDFSPTKHPDFLELLKHWKIPTTLIAGDQDQKYVQQNRQAESLAHVQVVVIPQSGHRVIFDQPEILEKMLIQK